MSRDVTQSVLEALDSNVIYPFFALELQFDAGQTVRLWTGQGILVYGGFEWAGTGNLLQFDTIEETSEIAAKGATVTLSGVGQDVLALALTEPYQGRVAKIYFGTFNYTDKLLKEDAAYLLMADGSKILLEDRRVDITEIFSGYMDQMNIDEGPETSTVTLTIENKLIDLERPRTARFTSAYQKSLFPNDLGLDFVEDLQTKEIVWGRSVA